MRMFVNVHIKTFPHPINVFVHIIQMFIYKVGYVTSLGFCLVIFCLASFLYLRNVQRIQTIFLCTHSIAHFRSYGLRFHTLQYYPTLPQPSFLKSLYPLCAHIPYVSKSHCLIFRLSLFTNGRTYILCYVLGIRRDIYLDIHRECIILVDSV